TTRFVTCADPEEVQDIHQTGPKAHVKRLYHVLRIFWEREKDQAGDYTLIPVAQLERFGEEIRLSERFIPPSLAIQSSDLLFNQVREIRDQISARSRQLEEYKRQKGIHTAEFGARDMVYLLALRSLNRYVPLLFHMTEAQQVHPWTVYGLLRQLIGELSSFSEKIKVMGEEEDGTSLLPRYDHWDLWACFSAARSLIAQLLDEITAGPEYVIPLLYDGTYFTADLPQELFDAHNSFYLAFKTDAEPQSIIQSLTTIAKVNSRDYLPLLIARSLPGLRLEYQAVPPQELPRRAHCLYFRLDHHSDQWSSVEKSRNISLYWDDAPQDLEIEIMAVGRSS
ncbi:MAG: type VI secretion system baseplate subunit TssK, partial [bacterium]